METVTRGDSSDLAGPPRLGENEIHAWIIRLGLPRSDASPGRDILSPDEQKKAARFKQEADRHRYIASHRALRKLLGGYLGIPPALLKFQTEQFGKPVLDGHSSSLSFNLAHSGDMAVIGVAQRARLGVDVELWRADAISRGVMERFCSPDELEMIERAHGKARLRAFFRQWTAKEAYLKAVGCGLVDEVCSVEIPVTVRAGTGPLEIVKTLSARHDPVQSWLFYDLTAQDGYSAALVIESNRRFVLRKFMASSE